MIIANRMEPIGRCNGRSRFSSLIPIKLNKVVILYVSGRIDPNIAIAVLLCLNCLNLNPRSVQMLQVISIWVIQSGKAIFSL